MSNLSILNNPSLKKIEQTQKAAIRIVSFSDFHAHTDPIFKELNVIKFQDYLLLQNVLFVHDFINNKLPPSFDHFLIIRKNVTIFETRTGTNMEVCIPRFNQVKYGHQSIKNTCVNTWNNTKNIFPQTDLRVYQGGQFILIDR